MRTSRFSPPQDTGGKSGRDAETRFGFDAFCRKWEVQPPAWSPAEEKPLWGSAATEDERCRAYREHMGRTGGDRFTFPEDLRDGLRRAAAAGLPLMDILDGLLAKPETSDREAVVVLFQRVFGIPISRARYIASWTPTNRGREAEKVLARVSLCIADARRAGLWSAPGEET